MTVISHDALRCCRLCHGLSDEALDHVVPVFTEVTAAPGQTLFREGDGGDGFYLVIEGSVRLIKHVGGAKTLPVAELGPGDVFGEMSLISDAPRTTDCVVAEPARLWKLSRTAFDGLRHGALSAHTAVVHNLAALLCQRLAEATTKTAALIDRLTAAESRKEGLQQRVDMNRSGLVGFLSSFGR